MIQRLTLTLLLVSIMTACTTPDPEVYIQALKDRDYKILEKQDGVLDRTQVTLESGRTPLHYAVIEKDNQLLEYLLKNTVNLNSPDSSGATPLFLAVMTEDLVAVKNLLNAGADPNIPNNHRYPITYAIAHDNADITRLLMESGANLNVVNRDHLTPLLMAIDGENMVLFNDLLAAGADPNMTVNEVDLPIHRLIYNADDNEYHESQRLSMLQSLIKAGAEMSARTSDDQDILWLAIDYKRPLIAQYLLQQEPNTQYNEADLTDLLFLAIEQLPELIEPLLSKGVSYQSINKYGETTLMQAAYAGRLKLVQELIAQGLDVNAVSKSGWTALHYAINYDWSRYYYNGTDEEQALIVRTLIKAGANPNVYTRNHVSPFYLAAMISWPLTMTELHKGGADIDAARDNGVTPLLYALDRSQYDIAKWLVEHHADVTKKSRFCNSTPLLVLASDIMMQDDKTSKQIAELAQLFIDAGVNVRTRDCSGESALDMAERNKRPLLKKVLQKALK
ncbi:ankyrin repeat domain-containing protein [Gynuella sp.]|uniref:ankyrin repeat domain-containing protein n=1 Tax=Gynuella sp. TaxID=2969146 RepID=UPI003D150B7D